MDTGQDKDAARLLLRDLSVGETGRIKGFVKGQNREYRTKLLAMGLTPETEFAVSRVAPLGDPIEVRIRGFSLSLRKREAGILLVERIELP